MKNKRWLFLLFLAAWLSASAAHGQQSASEPIYPPPAPLAKDGAPVRPAEHLAPPSGGLSDWIVYRRDCCEGREGAATPLYTELYVNVGVTLPVGGMTLSRELKAGWSFTGGARALFFNEPQTRAWVVDLHIININESAGVQNTQFPVLFLHNGTPSNQVVFQGATRNTFSIQNSQRTLVGLGLGREWYLWKPATDDGCKWRIGLDGGGRYGTHRVNFNEFGHITDVIGSMYVGVHSQVEVPWRSWLFHAGVRFEWAYTWSDILQRTSDVQDVSVLLSAGIRF